MKKKEPWSKSEFIRNVVVYRENLEEIIQLFESKEMKITISDSGFEYSELDEIAKQHGYHLQELDISGDASGGNYGSISVSFSKDRTHVHASGSGAPKELWYELVVFLKNHRSWKKRIFNPFIWYFVAIIAFNVEIFAFLKESVRSSTPLWVHVALVILMVSWPLSYAYSRTLTTVKLIRRHEGGFWGRNKEAVILLIMGAVLGGIATYIVTLLTK